MSDPYPWVKLVHLLGGALLLGTGLGTAFQLYVAHRRGHVGAIAVVARTTVLADWVFIAGPVLMQPVSGLALVTLRGLDPLAGWLLASYALYALAIACWLGAVVLQYRVRALAEAACVERTALPARYARAMRAWFVLGWPALGAVLAIHGLMVWKPGLW